MTRLCCLLTSFSKRGPWLSVLYLSSIAVSIQACLLHLVPRLINNYSREHLHILQARKSIQADDVVDLWFQSQPIPPLDGHIFRRGIWDHSVGNVFYSVQCKGGYQTLEELGRHTQPLFRDLSDPRLRLEEYPRGGHAPRDIPLVAGRMRVSHFRAVRVCGRGARTLL